MSALGLLDQPAPPSGIWSTRDPLLACTLGSLGFPARGTLPIMITYDAKRIVAVTRKGITDLGGMNDLAEVEVSFAYEIHHPNFNRLNCSMVAAAHELAKLRQKNEIGTINGVERAQMTDLAVKVKRSGLPDVLQFVIQTLYDHICNWHVMCDSIQELNHNPFLKFSRSLKRNGVAITLNPLETETTANRRSERLFRGAE